MKNWDALEKRLEEMLSSEKRDRLLRYALEKDILTKEQEEAFFRKARGTNDKLELLNEFPCVTMLCWVRYVFLHCNGSDFHRTFREAIHADRSLYNPMRDLASRFIHAGIDKVCRKDFFRECWLIQGDEGHGETSEIWRSLTPLIRYIKPRINQEGKISNEKLHDWIEDFREGRLDDLPVYHQRLIEERDPSFLAGIFAMATNSGDGWLASIAPLYEYRADSISASAKWMLYVNGHQIRLDLLVDEMYVPGDEDAALTLRQNNAVRLKRTVPAGEGSGRPFFSCTDLVDAGINPANPMQVYLNRTKAALEPMEMSPEMPILFAYPMTRASNWYPSIKTGKDEHRSTHRLIAAVASGQDREQLQWGGRPVKTEFLGQFQFPGEDAGRFLWTVDIESNDSTEPQSLTYQGKHLLHVGPKPRLDIEGIEGVSHIDYPNAVVVSGDSTVCCIRNRTAKEHVQWYGENVRFDTNSIDPLRVTIHRNNTPYGEPVRVRAEGVRADIVFIPADALEENSPQWDRNIEADISLARVGAEKIVLSHGACMIPLQRPLSQMVWWFEHIQTGDPRHACKKMESVGYQSLQPYRLCFSLPEKACLTLNGEPFEEGAYDAGVHPIPIGLKITNAIDFNTGIGEEVDTLRLGDTEVLSVLRAPDKPIVTLNPEGSVCYFVPSEFEPNGSRYTAVCVRESDLSRWQEPLAIQVLDMENNSSRGQLIPLCDDFQQDADKYPGQGQWVLLVRHPEAAFAPTLFNLPSTKGVDSALPVCSADANSSLASRLNVAGEDQVDLRVGIATLLTLWEQTSGCPNILQEAILQKEDLGYGVDRSFWDSYFKGHCAPEPILAPKPKGRRPRNHISSEPEPSTLQQTLGLMLRCGFNWCAEANWAGWALDTTETVAYWQRKWKTRSSSRRKKFHDWVRETCPLLLSLKSIRQGYPKCDTTQYPCPGLKNYLKWDQEVWGLKWKDLPGNPLGLRRIGGDGVHLTGISTARPVAFSYHGEVEIQHPRGYCDFGIQVDNPSEFQRVMLSQIMTCDTDIRLGIEGPILTRVKDLFNQVLECATPVLGESTEGSAGLGYGFRLISEGLCEDDCSVESACLFHTAVLCRLHAWYGHEEGSYPDDWPLEDQNQYALLCGVVNRAWADERYWMGFQKNLIHIEWLLAWFHL